MSIWRKILDIFQDKCHYDIKTTFLFVSIKKKVISRFLIKLRSYGYSQYKIELIFEKYLYKYVIRALLHNFGLI